MKYEVQVMFSVEADDFNDALRKATERVGKVDAMRIHQPGEDEALAEAAQR